MDISKAICLMCCAAFAVTAFSSCGDGTTNDSENDPVHASERSLGSARELLDVVLEEFPQDSLDTVTSKGDDTSNGFDAYCEKLYGVSSESLSDGVIAYASSGGLADEISVLGYSDTIDSGELTSLLQDRVVRRHGDFEGYKPEELDKIDSAQVFECGDYVVLIISDDANELKETFLNLQ